MRPKVVKKRQTVNDLNVKFKLRSTHFKCADDLGFYNERYLLLRP